MSASPPRMYLRNMYTEEEMVAQYNPEQVKLTVGPLLTRLQIPAVSHQIIQYQGGSNPVIKFSLKFESLSGAGEEYIKNVEGFMLATTLPPDEIHSLNDAALPPLLLIWPGWLALGVLMTGFEETATEFAIPPADPSPTFLTYDVTIEVLFYIPPGSHTMRKTAWQVGA